MKITASGFLLIVINFICLVIYAPHLDKECPSWVYLSWVVGIFTYQVLDNIDGKQARRTNSSTPLGEIFDHGITFPIKDCIRGILIECLSISFYDNNGPSCTSINSPPKRYFCKHYSSKVVIAYSQR